MALKRDRNPMHDFVRDALVEEGLVAAYEARPDYQQNDYLWWIARPKREETRRRRLAQMVDESAATSILGMAWRGGR